MLKARPVEVVLASGPPRPSAVDAAPPAAPVGTRPSAAPTTQRPLRRVLLGDSITFGIPPHLGGYGEFVPGAW